VEGGSGFFAGNLFGYQFQLRVICRLLGTNLPANSRNPQAGKTAIFHLCPGLMGSCPERITSERLLTRRLFCENGGGLAC
jgi:hypothetical protein